MIFISVHPWPLKCVLIRGMSSFQAHINMKLQLGLGKVSWLGWCPHFRGVL